MVFQDVLKYFSSPGSQQPAASSQPTPPFQAALGARAGVQTSLSLLALVGRKENDSVWLAGLTAAPHEALLALHGHSLWLLKENHTVPALLWKRRILRVKLELSYTYKMLVA